MGIYINIKENGKFKYRKTSWDSFKEIEEWASYAPKEGLRMPFMIDGDPNKMGVVEKQDYSVNKKKLQICRYDIKDGD